MRKAIYLFCSLLFLFHSFGCQSLRNSASSPEWNSLNTVRLLEIKRILSIVGNEIWPGYGDSPLRLVLVDGPVQWAINVKPLPPHYQSHPVPHGLESIVSDFAQTRSYRDAYGVFHPSVPNILYTSYSKEQTDHHFQHSIYFVHSLELFQKLGEPQSTEEWIHISIHELFHTFQDKQVEYTPEFIKRYTVHFKEKIQSDRTHQNLLKPEYKLLAKAACEPNPKIATAFLKNALKRRTKRWLYIQQKYQEDPSTSEQYEAWVEGTARYVEHQIMKRVPEYQQNSKIEKDPYFEGFRSYEAESQEGWCADIAKGKSKYWYFLGFAYALILDKLDPDWKSHTHSKSGFFDGEFKRLGVSR